MVDSDKDVVFGGDDGGNVEVCEILDEFDCVCVEGVCHGDEEFILDDT